MLIIYRTNPGYEGNIVSLDYQTPPAATTAWLAQSGLNAELGCLEIDQAVLAEPDLADLVLNYADPTRWYVAEVDEVLSLMQGGA